MARRGNWDRVIRKFQTLQRDMEQALCEATIEAANLVEGTVIGHLKNQDLGWQPLTEAYLKRKKSGKKRGSRRLSGKTLIATRTYFQSITSEVDGMQGFVGVKRGVAREADGTDVFNIAMVHEHGSSDGRIPARELWAPTILECRSQVADIYRRKAEGVLRR